MFTNLVFHQPCTAQSLDHLNIHNSLLLRPVALFWCTGRRSAPSRCDAFEQKYVFAQRNELSTGHYRENKHRSGSPAWDKCFRCSFWAVGAVGRARCDNFEHKCVFAEQNEHATPCDRSLSRQKTPVELSLRRASASNAHSWPVVLLGVYGVTILNQNVILQSEMSAHAP